MTSILLVLSNMASLCSSIVVYVGKWRESCDNSKCWFSRLVLMKIIQWMGGGGIYAEGMVLGSMLSNA